MLQIINQAIDGEVFSTRKHNIGAIEDLAEEVPVLFAHERTVAPVVRIVHPRATRDLDLLDRQLVVGVRSTDVDAAPLHVAKTLSLIMQFFLVLDHLQSGLKAPDNFSATLHAAVVIVDKLLEGVSGSLEEADRSFVLLMHGTEQLPLLSSVLL